MDKKYSSKIYILDFFSYILTPSCQNLFQIAPNSAIAYYSLLLDTIAPYIRLLNWVVHYLPQGLSVVGSSVDY